MIIDENCTCRSQGNLEPNWMAFIISFAQKLSRSLSFYGIAALTLTANPKEKCDLLPFIPISRDYTWSKQFFVHDSSGKTFYPTSCGVIPNWCSKLLQMMSLSYTQGLFINLKETLRRFQGYFTWSIKILFYKSVSKKEFRNRWFFLDI